MNGLPAATADIHVTVPRGVKRRSESLLMHRTTDLDRRDRFLVDGLPCTSPARTIIDLAATLDGEALEHAFEAARRMGLTTRHVLERRAVELCHNGRPGSTAVRELLRIGDGRPKESRLEVRTARLLRSHGLRPECTQHRVERFRLDFAWPSSLYAVECDGFEWHGNRLAWKRDRSRIARLETLGWRITHVTWDDVTDRPDETVARIRGARTTGGARRCLGVHGRG